MGTEQQKEKNTAGVGGAAGAATAKEGHPLPLEQWQESIEAQLSKIQTTLKNWMPPTTGAATSQPEVLKLSARLAKIENHIEKMNGAPIG
jgi:hypothetical protein